MSVPIGTPELVAEFHAHLPARVDRHVHRNEAVMLAVHDAVTKHRWPTAALAEYASHGLAAGNVTSVGSVVLARLRMAARGEVKPPQPARPKARQSKPWCGQCSDAGARWAFTESGEPARRCDCWSPIPVAP